MLFVRVCLICVVVCVRVLCIVCVCVFVCVCVCVLHMCYTCLCAGVCVHVNMMIKSVAESNDRIMFDVFA